MKTPVTSPIAKTAILVLAEIEAATRAFEEGKTNVFDTLDAIEAAMDAYRDAVEARRDAA